MDRVIGRVSDVFRFIGMGFLALVVICASIDVFNRLVAGASLAWAQQAAVWLNLFVIFLIAPGMLIEGGHIRVVFLFDRLKGLTRKIVDYMNDIALLAFSVLAICGGVAYTLFLVEKESSRVFGIWYFPYWIIALIIPVGMGLLLLFGLYQLSTKFRKKEEK